MVSVVFVCALVASVAPSAAAASESKAEVTGASAAVSQVFSILRTSSPSEAVEAIRALDSNRDGVVTFDEVAAFAKAKGLDYSSTLQEFSGFDADRNGQLDSFELAKALGVQAPTTPQAVPSTPQYTFMASRGSGALKTRLATAVQAAPAAGSATAHHGISAASVSGDSAEEFVAARTADVERRVASLSEYANGIAVEAEKEAEAQELDRQAAVLRANATAIVRKAQQAARRAGANAAYKKAQAIFDNLEQLEKQATNAEVRAAALKAKSEAELKEVNDVMSVAEMGLQKARAV